MADGTAESRPFGLEISQVVCDRATRLAKTMFSALEAQIVFLKDGDEMVATAEGIGTLANPVRAEQVAA